MAGPLNVNGNQVIDMILENLSSDPPTTTVGRVYFNTTDDRPHVFVA